MEPFTARACGTEKTFLWDFRYSEKNTVNEFHPLMSWNNEEIASEFDNSRPCVEPIKSHVL